MSKPYVVDAHSLVWHLAGSTRLSAKARAVMDDFDSVLHLPIIALSEACWVVERGKSSIPTVAALLADVDADPRISVVPLEREILDLSLKLTSLPEMHDRLIVATALYLVAGGAPIPLLTCDGSIVASGLVPVVW